MIVYRSERRNESTRERLSELIRDAHAWTSSAALDHDAARDLLIEIGIVEAGIADLLAPEMDAVSPLVASMRSASTAAGRMFVASWIGAPRDEQRALGHDVIARLEALTATHLPATIAVGAPEGYAYYALYPEQYVAAANDLASSMSPRTVVCIGVRSIGTSLSAAVAATLERRGCAVRSYTVRPRGHPFDREIVLAPELRRELAAQRDAIFVIVDEGPGMSGSSFASVAKELTSLGVADDHVVLMPSWATDGSGLVSETARARWQRHRNFVSAFEEQWICGERLARSFAADGTLTDVSAGAWRDHIHLNGIGPAVQPEHERRKYLLRRDNGPTLLLKFAGLGRIGRSARARAQRIADAGFGPPPIDLQHGFIATELLDATPLSAADTSEAVIDRLADYLAFVSREFAVSSTSDPEQFRDMVEVNTLEALGDSAHHALRRLLQADVISNARPVALDGRMFPHEWLRSGDTLLKVDATDHHDDHFFPGTQDIAWDLAGTSIEFDLDDRAERYLLERYMARTGDSGVPSRMPFYRVAYLASRVGYATLAGQSLGGSAEGRRWCTLAAAYRSQLHGACGALAPLSSAA